MDRQGSPGGFGDKKREREMIMSRHRGLAVALWVLAAAAAFAIGAAWADDARSGKITPWALVALFWSAALVSVLIHYLAQGPVLLSRYRHEPPAAPSVGPGSGSLVASAENS